LAHLAGGQAWTLGEYLQALESFVQRAKARGAAGLKSLLAYRRSLAHGRPERETAAKLYQRCDLTPPEQAVLEDFMVHAAARLAGEYGLPFQIHVGYGSWQSNITEQANPLLLNPLIEAHRQTKFVLLHGGYPFIGEMATLAKNHPNVYIEAGWLAYIAPAAYRRAMAEWLDAVPASKILAFSADCLHVEQTYGALLLARRLLAQCLAEKADEAGWDLSLCLEVARWLMYSNAAELYRL
jgi:predicted TIM-barrel fold metal-dependent hydrolase